LLPTFQPIFEAILNVAILFAVCATFNVVVETDKYGAACVTIMVSEILLPVTIIFAIREVFPVLADAVIVIVALSEPVVLSRANHVWSQLSCQFIFEFISNVAVVFAVSAKYNQ
jgi:hypothetical protein